MTMHHARSKPPKEGPKCRGCEHWQWRHGGDGKGACWPVEGCTCPRYQPPKKDYKRKSTRNQAKDKERHWGKHTGAKRQPAGVAAQQRQGDPDLVSKIRIWQIKHWRAISTALINHGWEQAWLASRGTGKRPLLGLSTKEGVGHPSTDYVVEELSQWLLYNGRDDGKEAQ